MSIPKNFRKLSPKDRRQALGLNSEEIAYLKMLEDKADIAIESSVGTTPIPLGVATKFLIDGEEMAIPMATEEPSVIAGATYAASIIAKGGGFQTDADEPTLSAQVFIEDGKEEPIQEAREKIKTLIEDKIPSLIKRGGGFRGLETNKLGNVLIVTFTLAVVDAMGANILNTTAEALKDPLAKLSGGKVLMAIVSNSASDRKATAYFKVPTRLFSGEEVCRRIVLATDMANKSSDRAVTHNKGVMNGISALALATGNDTRAIEAAAHTFAAGKSLTSYRIENDHLIGEISLPLSFGTVGGAISFWPASQLALKILKNPNAQRLSQIAAALGLAQNLAALFALVTEGIQAGHMRLHNRKGNS
jgi:hydroxymethylglutaryl-CoA reductase